ncbi:MAG: xanthine dehydrogenase family protein molybdopterin-binding subunit [Candidatus Caldarchaeum sp.]|nr:xanthine dehydrogenase family protein molybdopterin-binding subunit [Candidatus Caldarchaeum sp.]MDW8435281.1 xanthine dehydrogenase family protein molybdopterin-binding subunit [Candidatus Caldarchaeum sp.]
MTQRLIGSPVRTKEGFRHVRGRGRFVDDISLPKTSYVAFLRSPYPHAIIKSIDVSRAQQATGVYGVYTGADVAAVTKPFPQLTVPPASRVVDYSMAVRKVRFVGEPVAAVVADSFYHARDAVELIEADYEPLKPVSNPLEVLEGNTPLIHEEAGTNIAATVDYNYGDYDSAAAKADRIIRAKLTFHRFSSTPLEPNAVLASYDESTGYTIFCNNQMPMFLSPSIIRALDTEMTRVRFVTQDIGGGFGVKILNYTYMVLVAALSKLARRPVKWIETRTEHMMASSHGADRHFSVEAAVKNDGTLLGLNVVSVDDIGAYARHEPAGLTVWAQVASGCCKFKHLRQKMYAVFTNKCPAGPNRGFSRAPHQFMIERILDRIAKQLGKDPVEIRKINYVSRDEQPYRTLNGCVYDGGDYYGALEKAASLVDYWGWRQKQPTLREQGRFVGVGVGVTIDSGAANFGQVRMLNPALPNVGTSEAASVQMTPDGNIVVKLGTVPQGQSHETIASQIVADVLGIDYEDVLVATGFDSSSHPYTLHSGTYASRFAGTGMVAIYDAAMRLKDMIASIAAKILEARKEDIVVEGGAAYVRDAPERKVSFKRIARTAYANPFELPEGMEPGLTAQAVFSPKFEPPDQNKVGNLTLTYSYQAHAVVVEVDPESGAVKIIDYAIVDDCGRVINPAIVDGQVHGAAYHGVGAVLYENFEYDEDGRLLTSSFMDYLTPTALDTPGFKCERISIPSPFTPLGAKGVGEGCGAPIPAIVAAVEDAVKHLDGEINVSHIKPETVYRIISKSSRNK